VVYKISSVLFCFSVDLVQAVTISLSMVGFGESIASLIHQDSVWISRIIAVGILLLLLGNYICICPTSPPALCYYQTVFSAGHCCEVRILSHYALHCAVM